MTKLETIDILDLDCVTGGADEGGENREKIQIGIQGEGEGGKGNFNLGLDLERMRTNYAVCVQEARAAGAAPKDIKDMCGLPPA